MADSLLWQLPGRGLGVRDFGIGSQFEFTDSWSLKALVSNLKAGKKNLKLVSKNVEARFSVPLKDLNVWVYLFQNYAYKVFFKFL